MRRPSLVVIVREHVPPSDDVYARGVRVAVVSVVRNHPGALDPLIKSGEIHAVSIRADTTTEWQEVGGGT